jgi:hypothetical protein
MGTWGVGLYAGDTACDVRDTWLKKVRQGAPPEVATRELVEEWSSGDQEPLFWLALADTQWKWGRLEKWVREEARRVLAAGADLELWQDSKELEARKRVFDRLAAQLKEPPPPPKPIRVRGDAIDWKRGQLWSYRTLDGKYAVLRVCAFDPECGLAGAPLVELLDVALDTLPAAGALKQIGARPARLDYNASGRYDFFEPQHRASPLFEPKSKRRGELPRHRLRKLRAEGEPRAALPTTKTIGVPWDAMDEFLPNMFDVGGPRLGAVHAWPLASGGTAYTVVELMNWPDTLPEPYWQLGFLDCEGPDPAPRTIEMTSVLRSIAFMGFPPAGGFREVGYRAPVKSAFETAGLLHRQWGALSAFIQETADLRAEDRARKRSRR